MSTSHLTLGAAADSRKARLAQLKSLKRKAPSSPPPTESEERARRSASPPPPTPSVPSAQDAVSRHLSGRNYDPATKGPKLGFEAPPTLQEQTLEERAADAEAEVRRKAAEEEAEDKAGLGGVDLFELQPKRPNWDLKRDLARKLEVLDVRTDNAIARLVRERIAAAKEKAVKKVEAGGGRTTNGGEEVGVDGVTMVEGLREREREGEEEARKEKEDEELA